MQGFTIRGHLIIFLAALSVSATGLSIPLVDILCDYLSFSGSESLSGQEEWKELVRHLESRTGYDRPQGALIESETFKKCVQAYSSEMDLGEFVLQGRETIQESLNKIEKPTEIPPALIPLQLSQEERQLSTPEISISLPDETVVESSVSQERVRARLEQYNSLWESFLAVLRNKLVPSL
jgi:hypothetical protein